MAEDGQNGNDRGAAIVRRWDTIALLVTAIALIVFQSSGPVQRAHWSWNPTKSLATVSLSLNVLWFLGIFWWAIRIGRATPAITAMRWFVELGHLRRDFVEKVVASADFDATYRGLPLEQIPADVVVTYLRQHGDHGQVTQWARTVFWITVAPPVGTAIVFVGALITSQGGLAKTVFWLTFIALLPAMQSQLNIRDAKQADGMARLQELLGVKSVHYSDAAEAKVVWRATMCWVAVPVGLAASVIIGVGLVMSLPTLPRVLLATLILLPIAVPIGGRFAWNRRLRTYRLPD